MIYASVGGAVLAICLFALLPRRRIGAWSQQGASIEGERPIFGIVGGASWRTGLVPWTATPPLARLDVYAWGIKIGSSVRILRWSMPTTELRWEEIAAVRRIRMGIQFEVKARPGECVRFGMFMQPHPEIDPRLRQLLTQSGVPIEE